MTRTATTKLVATALAVASLGLASTAQADEAQGIAVGEPTPGQPVPAQTQNQGTENPAPADQAQNQQGPVKEPTQEELDQQRFDRYCNMKDAEPSHSDKKFCEDFRKTHPVKPGEPNGHGPLPIDCKHPRNTTEAQFCKERPPVDPVDPVDPPVKETGSYHKPYYEHASEPSKGSLPFTGLEIWQLGLIGVVLVGGGIGARRLLAA